MTGQVADHGYDPSPATTRITGPATRTGSRWRAAPAMIAALGVLIAMGAVLVVFSTTRTEPAPAAAAPVVGNAVLPAPRAPTPPAAPVVTPTELAQCPATSSACVDLRARKAWLQHDGRVAVGPVPMLAGRETFLRPPGPTSSATPTGTFQVLRKDKDAFSSEFDEPMNHAVYFAPGGIAFHEGSLTTSSNGCIHLSAADAATFFDLLSTGDGVTVF